MIEQIARILCKQDGHDPDLSLGGDEENYWWIEYKRDAEEILGTMLDYSDEMFTAGLDYSGDPGRIYTVMINKALEEKDNS